MCQFASHRLASGEGEVDPTLKFSICVCKMWILLLTHFPLHGPRKVSQKVAYNDFRPYPLISLREANEFFEQFSLTSSLESTITDCTSKENVTFRFLNFCSSFWNFSIPIYMLTKSYDHMMTLLIGLDTEYKQTTLTSCFSSFCRLLCFEVFRICDLLLQLISALSYIAWSLSLTLALNFCFSKFCLV